MIFFHTMYYICTLWQTKCQCLKRSLYTAANKYQLGWLTSKQDEITLVCMYGQNENFLTLSLVSSQGASRLGLHLTLRKWIIRGVISCSLLPYFTFQGFSFFSSCRFLTIFKTSPLSGFLYFLLQSTPPPLSASDIPLVTFMRRFSSFIP